MYKLKYFTEENNEKVIAFMRHNSFAIITGIGEQYPVATHVPLDVQFQNDKIIFTGHIMKNSDHHKAFEQNKNVLVMFNGANCQVKASWYPNPVQASTWNYITVHAKGKINFGDEASTKKIVEDLTNKYEPPESAAAFKNLPGEYIDRLVKAIIGFTIEVEIIDNVFKLSQNHEIETRKSIIAHLEKSNNANAMAIAEEMTLRIDAPKQQR